MKYACYQHKIVIQTDPKNYEYLVIGGVQKKVEEFDTANAKTMVLAAVDEEKSKLIRYTALNFKKKIQK